MQLLIKRAVLSEVRKRQQGIGSVISSFLPFVESHYAGQAASNSQQSPCSSLLHTRSTGVHWLPKHLSLSPPLVPTPGFIFEK